MKINCIKSKDNRLKYNVSIGHKQMLFRQSSPVDEFYREEMLDKTSVKEDKKSVSYCNPLYLLLNQQRIERQGQMNLEQWLSGFDLQKVSSLDQLRSKCTDQDLCRMIKSRHLQAPAEILAWMRYMSDNMEQFNKELAEVVKAQEQEQVTEQNVGSSNTE